MNRSIINTIIDLLNVSDFYDKSELIDVAKGKYELPTKFKDIKNVVKRNKKY